VGEVKMGREWMRRGRKNSWEGDSQGKGGKVKEVRIDKKIVIVKLIIQKKKSKEKTNKKTPGSGTMRSSVFW
jgi:ribosomal protein L24